MKKAITRKKKKVTYDILGDVNEYNMLRQRKKTLEKRMKELSDRIKEYAFNKGSKDGKGNMYITNNEHFIFGAVSKKKVTLNEEKAKEFLLSKGLYQKCVQTIEKIDEDILTDLVKTEEITVEDLEDIMDVKVSYSLDVKEKEKEGDEMPEIKTTKLRK